MKSDPREKTLEILNLIEHSPAPLDTLVETRIDGPRLFDRRDRGFFNHLLFGTVRWRGRLDWVIRHFSKTPLEKIEPTVLNILRLGLYQAVYLDRVPVSAAVDTSVEISKRYCKPHVVKFINALLRKAAARYVDVPLPGVDADPALRTAVTHAFPLWMVQRWQQRFGHETTAALCSAMNRIPEITLRANTLRTSRGDLFRVFTGLSQAQRLTRHANTGLGIVGPCAPIGDLAPFRDGWFQVQDEAAQLVSCLLNPAPGETVLDACCGFGGKTGHLAQLMENRGRIHAVDTENDKLTRLVSETRRLGIDIVDTWCADLTTSHHDAGRLAAYDRILVDAPCSGMGVIRRNPDVKWKRLPADPVHHQSVQQKLLDVLASRVKPGGVMVYAVCSFEIEENDEVVSRFLKKHPEFAIDRSSALFADALNRFRDANGYFRTFPTMDSMDGFFAARLRRAA